MQERYARNFSALSEADMAKLAAAKVAVVGCGGLGGNLIELLGRIGVGTLIAADGDLFEESNLNRQILCDTRNLGGSKSEEAKRRMAAVNPLVRVDAVTERITAENGPEILRGATLIMDAVDTIPARLALQGIAETLGVPLVHGAIAGWYGQVCAVYPGDRTLNTVYGKTGRKEQRGIESRLGNLSFGPAFVASLQAAEAVKEIIGRGETLRGRLLIADLLDNDFEIIELPPEGKEEERK